MAYKKSIRMTINAHEAGVTPFPFLRLFEENWRNQKEQPKD
ncbi:MAG: hypothetical protein Q7S92_01555 [Candidatus Diapherotrites archaeon]|nr:hypothetical protein [Candidatus Diapherotrites archaeon]